MRGCRRMSLGVAVVCVAAGCRTATRIVEEPRVDLEVAGRGNRGYLLGTPPPVSEPRKTTRQIVETEIEVPRGLGRLAGPAPRQPVELKEVAPPEVDLSEPMAVPEQGLPQTFGTYVVKKGDTLWSIAADPAVFGDATKWRALYAANRDALKSPDQLRAGMTLRVPRGGSPPASGTGEEPTGTTVSTK